MPEKASSETLATCVNYAKINNSMLRMHGHVSASIFNCDVLFWQGKHTVFRHTVANAESEFF